METEEVIKLVDNIYKNILDKFNPGARQLISAGKAYLKALHGTAAASRVFNEALAKIAVNAQQGGTNDIGSALMNIVGVYKDIQDQHMNILKAFYVDLLVPLETNLEKDTKVVQFEQKKFMQQHKIRADSYSKATATMKKQRKKKGNAQNADKEIKSIQAVDEEKNKMDAFCEQSLKNAMTQERRRYGFVLERQCSLAKHWIAYHSAGKNFILNNLDQWEEVSASREFLPPNMENVFARQMIMDMNHDNGANGGANHNDMDSDDDDRGSVISAIRKTRSIDASCLDMRSIGDVVNSSAHGGSHMPRAKSEFNLMSTSAAAASSVAAGSSAGSTSNEATKWDQRTVSRGLYAYLSSGENQLSFLEGDRIALVGDRAKGWQFGENLRTHTFGWFPVAYTELEQEDSHNNWGASRNGYNGQQQTAVATQVVQQQQQQHQQQQQSHHMQQQHQHQQQQHKQQHNQQLQHRSHSSDHHSAAGHHQHQHSGTPDSDGGLDESAFTAQMLQHAYNEDASPTRMFGDTIMYRQSKQFRRVSGGVSATGSNGSQAAGPKPGPPPTLPAPVPQPVVPASYPQHQSAGGQRMTQSQSFMNGGGAGGGGAGSSSNSAAGGSSAQQLSNAEKRKSMPAGVNYGKQVGAMAKPKSRNGVVAVNNASLHSSNDSGFANEPAPPQPDVDYSDDETMATGARVPIRSQALNRSPSNVNAVSSTNTANKKTSSRTSARRDVETTKVPTKSSSTLTRPTKHSASSGIRTSTSYGNLVLEDAKQNGGGDADFSYRTIERKSTAGVGASPLNGDGNGVKRTKSFWKFGKSDDILEGMAMWRHNDLVTPDEGLLDGLDSDAAVAPVPTGETATLRRTQRMTKLTPQPDELSQMSSAHSTETLTNIVNLDHDINHNAKQQQGAEVGDYVVQNGMIVDGNNAGGNKYHFTKSEIDNRISAMQQQQQQQQHHSQHQPQPQHKQQQQQSQRASLAYETAPEDYEEEEESIYDVQPKTRQMMSNMNVMSRDKVIRQAYLENERDMQQQQQLQQQQQQQQQRSNQPTDKYRSRAADKQQKQAATNNNNAAVAVSATSTAKKSSKKSKPSSSSAKQSPAAVAAQQPAQQQPLDYYSSRAETPETIHHDDNQRGGRRTVGNDFDDDDNDEMSMHENAVRVRDTDFYDDESADDVAIMMKTVKRQDILKQYYNSSDGGTDDTEQNSTSSDAYDCIVVEDHHVVRRGGGGGNMQQQQPPLQQQQLHPQQHHQHQQQPQHHQQHNGQQSAKMEFKTFRGGSDDKDSGMESSRPGTLLPRTKLAKTNSGGNAAPAAAINGKTDKSKRSRGGDRSTEQQQLAPQSQQQQQRGDRGERTKERGDRERKTDGRDERRERPHDGRKPQAQDYRTGPSDIESTPSVKSYGPWYDLWDKDVSRS